MSACDNYRDHDDEDRSIRCEGCMVLNTKPCECAKDEAAAELIKQSLMLEDLESALESMNLHLVDNDIYTSTDLSALYGVTSRLEHRIATAKSNIKELKNGQ